MVALESNTEGRETSLSIDSSENVNVDGGDLLASGTASIGDNEEDNLESPVGFPVNVRGYFSLISVSKEGNKILTKATCNLCSKKEGSQVYRMYDRNTFGFLRHLRVIHLK